VWENWKDPASDEWIRTVGNRHVSPAASRLDAVQTAFHEHHALQCGFCTPGMVMSVRQLLRDRSDANEDEIRHGGAGNICRCTGFHNIVRAVESLVAEG
jgi:carbon-monoxide dehydrogenase small subunit